VLLTDAPKVRRPEVKPLTPEQARTFLDAAQEDRLEALYRVALALGLRLGEALGLGWEDVDFDSGTLRVRRSLQRVEGKLTLKEPKTEKSRRALTMPRTLVAALLAHRDRQAYERAGAGEAWQESGLVFANTVGGPLEPSNVLKRYKALPAQRFHDLRHCATSPLIVQGVPIKVVADILGHTQLATTSDLYGHIFPAAHREAADLMDQILSEGR
jgi:integrase